MLSASSNIVLYRYIHQITACFLNIKKVDAYEKYGTEHPVLSMALWEKRQSCHPMFKFCNLILQFTLLLLEFVKSIRSGYLQLCINTLMKIAPWMFALDHRNYARWLHVHINEMSQLQQNHPGIYEEFLKGKFSVHKSNCKFSRNTADQNHKQLNAKIKGVSGAIGQTENETALQR